MNRSTDSHPEAQSLANYAAGLDVSISREMLEAHLETCDECAATVARAHQPTTLTLRIGDALRASGNKPNSTGQSLPLLLKRLEPSTYAKSLGRLAHYELLEVVGQGAFGIVFRAFDQSLARIVAIKVLSLDFPEGSVAQLRFLREARAAARIQHENVVRILAVAEIPLPYIVMEYVEGESLQSQLDRSAYYDPNEIANIGCQIAEGLAAAHACVLIHRDVKPDNILIEMAKLSITFDASTADRMPRRIVRLTDFGLARATDDAQGLTTERLVMGTPAFMSPEQVNAEGVDHRSDLFSLGCVLYTICCRRVPFASESIAATLRKVDACQAPAINTLAPSIPSSLVAVIDRLMGRDPADRFQTAAAVADALRALSNEDLNSGIPETESGRAHHERSDDQHKIAPRRSKNGRGVRRWLILLGVLVTTIISTTVFVITTNRGDVATTKTTDGPTSPDQRLVQWSEPARLNFVDNDSNGSNACISGDGLQMVFVKRIGESNSLCESYRKTTDAVFSVAKPISDLSLPAGYSSKVFGTPWFSHDALKLLVFAVHSGKNPGIDLWQTYRDSVDAPWHELRSLGATVNSRAADYAPSMSRDGLSLYWFRPNPSNVFDGDLWTAVRANEDADFTDSKKLNAIINTDASEQQPFPTADGLRLLFDRGTPEPRLWEAIRDDVRGDFNKVIRVELPETWRERCAYAPSMTADGKLLVFTSNRIPGKEGFESGELWQTQPINQN